MLQLPKYLASYNSPNSSSSSSTSESYDYSGLDEHLKRQEMLAGQRDAKFAALYGGDVAGSVAAGSRVRDLLKAIRMHSPDATERDPSQMVNPLVRVTSRSTSNSSSSDGPSWAGNNGEQPAPLPMPQPRVGQPPEVVAAPKKRDIAKEVHGTQVLGVDRSRLRDPNAPGGGVGGGMYQV